jgi:D-methionine transport system permease protein
MSQTAITEAFTAFFAHVDPGDIALATGETLLMLFGALILSVMIGLPLGVALIVTGPRGLSSNGALYGVLSLIVNALRSIPFVILLIVMIPLTIALVGTSLGVQGAIPPLVLCAAPFFARLVETALREVDPSVVEATQALGASKRQIILHTLLPEALPGIIAAVTVTAIALVSYTAMAGVVGAGGLGDLAVRYGYQRFQTDVMLVTVALMIILVQLLQSLGDIFVARFSHR